MFRMLRGLQQRPLLRAALLCAAATLPLGANNALAQDAASLKARHAALREPLARNAFQRPLVLESSEPAGGLKGDIYAQIEQPFAVAGPALRSVERWCDILILHLNVKRCHATKAGTVPPGTDNATDSAKPADKAASDMLALSIGRKFDQPAAEAYRFDFAFKVVAATPEYLQLALTADDGPLGTSNYRIGLEVVALDAKRSFLHMSYAYAYGTAARLAMQGYLATLGREKVGFSIVGRGPDGLPRYIGGTRGVIERNTMRYYLAVEAYLGALSLPLPRQLDKRLNDWHSGVERYPMQLHELERAAYLELKRVEVQRGADAARSR